MSDESDAGPGFAATWMSKHLGGTSGRQRYAVCYLKEHCHAISGSAEAVYLTGDCVTVLLH